MMLKKIQVLLLAAVFLLHYGLEQLYPDRPRNRGWRFSRFNIGIGLLNTLLTLPLAAAFVQGLSWLEGQRLGLLRMIALPSWMHFAATILVMDAWMYAWHRMNHEWRPLWRFHRFHHLDGHMNSSTALRFHLAELWLSYPGKALVCVLFGISYAPLLVYEVLFFCAIVLHHANIRIPTGADRAYRLFFASPEHHRIHHSDRPGELHSNYGAVFSFWDRLFGSFCTAPSGPIRFGVADAPARESAG